MPHPRDESNANTLPDPELNPLLNPLLAAHMGRWAEVYFTNPPEKRGQAIAELLRELENISPAEPAPVPVTQPESGQRKTETAQMTDPFPAAGEPAFTCGACAYHNAAGQRFCGMCGAPLHVSPEEPMAHVPESVPMPGVSWSEPEPSAGGVEYAMDPAHGATAAEGHHAIVDQNWLRPERSFPNPAEESAPVPYRYRLYAGVVLAILLVVLVYMAWRGTQALSGTAAPQPAPAKASAAPSTASATSAPPSSTMTKLPDRNPRDSPVRNQDQPDASSQKEQVAETPAAPRIVAVAASSSPTAPEPSGAEDLATAQKYLSGSAGVPRDSAEAAQWLWKAVRKRNLTATMVLSDLYLRGDGVPKSCDQARLLLDAAARKGNAAAAERLRNLQAFGCE